MEAARLSKTATIAVGGALAAAVLLASVTRSSSKKTKPRNIHSLDGTLPLLGDLVEVARVGDTFHDWLTEKSLHFNGEPWCFKVPGQPDNIVLTMPAAIEEVMVTQFDKFPKGEGQIALLSTMFGHGLLASDGERWHHQRKTAVKFFSAKVLRSFLKQAVHKSIGRITELLDKGETVDLKKMFHDFTLDTFVEMGLGVDLNCISSKDVHPFQAALDAASPVTSIRFRRPSWYWKLEQWLKVGLEGELARSMETIYGWLTGVIEQGIEVCMAKAAAANNTESPLGSEQDSAVKTVIELFFESSRDGVSGLEKEDLVDFVLTFLIAARDTTADTLSWFFYLIAKHPEVETKLRGELTAILDDLKDGEFVTTDQTKQMVYLEACIRETLRLYPAAPFSFREVGEDTVICGNVSLKKGEIIVMPAYAVGRMPQTWGSDAAEFRPERWIDSTTGSTKQFPASKFYAFSAGPRTCVGMNLAMMELRAVVANLFHRFKFHVDLETNDGSYVMSPTMTMKNPLLARVTRQ